MRKSLTRTEQKQENVDISEQPKDDIRDNYIHESKIMLLASILYGKKKGIEDIAVLFNKDDELGKKLQDLELKIKQRAPKKEGMVNE